MRCGVIPMQFHFITYGMELYTNDSIPINTNIEQCMCMRASGASELRKFWNFYILKLLFLSIFCRYIHWQITCIPWLNFIWGGGASAPPPPPVRQWSWAQCCYWLVCGISISCLPPLNLIPTAGSANPLSPIIGNYLRLQSRPTNPKAKSLVQVRGVWLKS